MNGILPEHTKVTSSALARRWGYFRLTVGLFGLALIVVTWPLWSADSEFPRVPLVAKVIGLGDTTQWSPLLNWCALLAMLTGLSASIAVALMECCRLQRETHRFQVLLRCASVFWIGGWLFAVLLDQHRLQPWAYQFTAIIGIAMLTSHTHGLRLCRTLAIGIYGWSALGKFDYQFMHTVGSEMVLQLMEFLRIGAPQHDVVARLALLLPAGELLVACCLMIPFTRRLGVIAAIGMHTTLILVLGPLGKNHEWGVLLWNCFFIAQAAILFWPLHRMSVHEAVETTEQVKTSRDRRVLRTWCANAVVLLMLAAPLGERWQRWDHWTSWALYAPHSSRVTMWIRPEAVPRLPASLQALIDDSRVNQWGWTSVPLPLWSLETQHAPIYPQARFQLGVAIGVAETASLDQQVMLELRGVSDRWAGYRNTEQLIGLDAMRRATSAYWFNAIPTPSRTLK